MHLLIILPGVNLCVQNSVVCQPLNQCYLAGTCQYATGTCTNIVKPDTTPCNDQNTTTLLDMSAASDVAPC